MPEPSPAVDLTDLRALADRAAARVPAVSAWSVGMHVEHCALAMLGIGRALLDATPPPPSDGLGLARRFILLTGWIRRGRARAPAAVVPGSERSPEELLARLDDTSSLLAEVRVADSRVWFRHAVLGVLDRDAALRFVAVHNAHHVKIARDILRRVPTGPG